MQLKAKSVDLSSSFSLENCLYCSSIPFSAAHKIKRKEEVGSILHLFFDLATAEKSSYEIIDPQKKGRRRSLQTFFRLLTGKHQAKQITCQGLASSSFTLFCGVAKHFFSVWRYARYRKKETRNRKCKWKKNRKENYRHALTKDEKKNLSLKKFSLPPIEVFQSISIP